MPKHSTDAHPAESGPPDAAGTDGAERPSHELGGTEHPRRTRNGPTAADLVATGRVSAQQAYAATLVLARLHDRGVALYMTIEEMCEVLGYLGDGRRPRAVDPDHVAPPHLRGARTLRRNEVS